MTNGMHLQQDLLEDDSASAAERPPRPIRVAASGRYLALLGFGRLGAPLLLLEQPEQRLAQRRGIEVARDVAAEAERDRSSLL